MRMHSPSKEMNGNRSNRSVGSKRSQNLHDSFAEQDDEEPTYHYK